MQGIEGSRSGANYGMLASLLNCSSSKFRNDWHREIDRPQKGKINN